MPLVSPVVKARLCPGRKSHYYHMLGLWLCHNFKRKGAPVILDLLFKQGLDEYRLVTGVGARMRDLSIR
jgi:hypothetical protein